MVAPERIVIALTASDGGLASCFTSVNAPPTLLPFIRSLGIDSLSDFVHFVTKAGYEAELKTCLDASPELAADRMALARLRAASVSGERALSNMSDHPATSTFGDLDDPLPDPTLQEVLKAWCDRYHIELEMHMAPADTLVSRFYRKYRRCTPTLVPIEKARSIFRAAEPEKDKALMLSGDVELTRMSCWMRSTTTSWGCAYSGMPRAGNFLARDFEGIAEIVFAP